MNLCIVEPLTFGFDAYYTIAIEVTAKWQGSTESDCRNYSFCLFTMMAKRMTPDVHDDTRVMRIYL